ncbi:MAG: hypothetical protein JSS98_13795 [Bacteroidetes bacterium]|nr:hypothetical protein [Bacteroidota bacterium]
MLKFSFLSALLFLGLNLLAQKDTIKLREISREKKNIITDRPPQAVYFQVGGAGVLLSGVYDRRFLKRVNGPGFAAGLGYYGGSGFHIFTVPVSLNYLFGRSNHFVEVAAGGTYISAGDVGFFNDTPNSESGVIIHANLGYRYQPTKGGFCFRGGFSPLAYKGEGIMYYYISFGYNF